MLDIHILESVLLFLSVEAVKQSLFHVTTLNVEDLDQTLIIALVAKQVIETPTLVIHIDFLMDHVTWTAHVC
jgi:hypothetical protein